MFKSIGAVWLSVILIFALIFAIGGGAIIYQKTFGVQQANVEREIWEESSSYIKGASKDLAQYRMEMQTADSESEEKAIVHTINSRFSDFPADKLDDQELAEFLRDVRNNDYEQYTGDEE